jgi:GNAT superfamily N-acetyltransferase
MGDVQVLVADRLSAVEVEELWVAYRQIFDDRESLEDFVSGVWAPHSTRDRLRVVRAYDDGQLVGFAYGYEGRSGQWFCDNARRVLPESVGAIWLDGHFEVVTMGVLPSKRQQGIGRLLLRTLTAGVGDRQVLMTSVDPSDPARALYASEGWSVIGRGITESQVIMGKRE